MYVFTYILLLCAPGPIPKLSSNYHKDLQYVLWWVPPWDHSFPVHPSLGSLLLLPGITPPLPSTWDHSSPYLGSLLPLPGITPPPPWDHSTPSLGSLHPLPGIPPPAPWDHSSSSLGSLLLPGITPPPPWDHSTPPWDYSYSSLKIGVVWTGDEAHAHYP